MDLPGVLARSRDGADLLGQIETTGVFHSTSRLAEPWGIAIPALPQVVVYHLLTSGRAVVRVEGTETAMTAGDLLVVPRGTGHAILGTADCVPLPLSRIPREAIGLRYDRMRIDGGGAPAGLICGAVRFTDLAVGRLMAELPPVLLVSAVDWTRILIEMIAEESERGAPGSDVVTARLADVLLVRAVRTWWATASQQHGWLAAVHDPYLGPALRAFHAEPGREWTLPRLAEVSGLSRSAFAARFTEMAATPAMTYVTDWRMDLAARLLAESRLTVAAVARRVGYGSVPGFTRAFQRAHGRPPGAWRADPPDALAEALALVEPQRGDAGAA